MPLRDITSINVRWGLVVGFQVQRVEETNQQMYGSRSTTTPGAHSPGQVALVVGGWGGAHTAELLVLRVEEGVRSVEEEVGARHVVLVSEGLGVGCSKVQVSI
jgi:hypothetical protein